METDLKARLVFFQAKLYNDEVSFERKSFFFTDKCDWPKKTILLNFYSKMDGNRIENKQ